MIDTSDTLIALGGSLSGIFAACLYAYYKSKDGTATQIQLAETVRLGKELEQRLKSSDGGCIAYAAVEGVVADLGKTFSTLNSTKPGVILHTSLIEHKSKRTQGFWSDVKKVLHESLEISPFALKDRENPSNLIIVTEVGEADGLMDDLEVTHNQFIPTKTSAMQAGIDRLFGEVCRGIQEREEMLVVGTSLMGIGEIFLEDGRLKLRPPQTDGAKFFLTKLSKNQLVKQLRSQGYTVKVFSFIFGAVAAGLLTFLVWRVVKRYQVHRKSQRDFEEIRQATLRRRSQARNSDETRVVLEDQTCVVCLSNPREVVTLDCGHIAMCSDCAQMLPTPHKCPVCRDPIIRFLPIYRP